MIEAELKARVRDPEAVKRSLEERSEGRTEVYRDTYYDTPDRSLNDQDRELRVRTVHGPEGTRSLLTYKEARVDEVSGSKPEHETQVSDPAAVDAMLRGLGYTPSIGFEKHCLNYEFEARGRKILATLVRVPEISGAFLEVETLIEQDDDLQSALDDIRAVLHALGIRNEDLTNELYTDAVASRTHRDT